MTMIGLSTATRTSMRATTTRGIAPITNPILSNITIMTQKRDNRMGNLNQMRVLKRLGMASNKTSNRRRNRLVPPTRVNILFPS
jgi:hypothetical protein